MVDYLQLVKNGIENEVQDLTMTSSLLRGFALKYHVPVIAAEWAEGIRNTRRPGC